MSIIGEPLEIGWHVHPGATCEQLVDYALEQARRTLGLVRPSGMPAMMPLVKRAEGYLELPPENKDRIIVMTMLNDIPMDKPITSDKYIELINKAESIAAK